MGWFSSKKEKKSSNELKKTRELLNAKLALFHEEYEKRIKLEDAPILDIIPIGNCWLEVLEGIQVIEPNFPYIKEEDTIIIINAKQGTSVGPHRHNENEVVHVISGMYKELVTGEVNADGDTKKYKQLTPHGMQFLKDTILMVHWKK
jgi:hypothetical protein